MSLFDEVREIVRKKNSDLQEISQRIFAKAKPYIIEAANDRRQYVDINISGEEIVISRELERSLLKAGLQGFTIKLYSGISCRTEGLATHLRVSIPTEQKVTLLTEQHGDNLKKINLEKIEIIEIYTKTPNVLIKTPNRNKENHGD